jgi:dimeric dUTPase (all-alpha-NTP-PPase superfamily)
MLKELLEMQAELDKEIIGNDMSIKTGKTKLINDFYYNNSHLLTQTILALQVELSEFANETRCFKHWSTKGLKDMDNEKALEEFIDALHFYLSIANQLEWTEGEIVQAYMKKNKINYDRQKNGY